MKFQSGQSGNPAGRSLGSLNRKTLALEAGFAERAEEILNDVIDQAKKGDRDARRLCMERILPRKREHMVAVDLPVIKTPEDAEAALAVINAELAAGHLTIKEATALVALVDRMLRVAERIWAFRRARRQGAVWDSVTLDDVEARIHHREPAEAGVTEAVETAEEPGAPLYSPVNSGIAIETHGRGGSPAQRKDAVPADGPRRDPGPLPAKAA